MTEYLIEFLAMTRRIYSCQEARTAVVDTRYQPDYDALAHDTFQEICGGA